MLPRKLTGRFPLFKHNGTIDQKIYWHSLLSFIFRGGSILANLIMVPLALQTLDKNSYGVWLTLGAVVTWFNFLDVGLGNGLRNKGAEALAREDFSMLRKLVSTAFWSVALVVSVFIILVLILFPLIQWNEIFNAEYIVRQELNDVLLCVVITFLLGVLFRLTTSLYLAFQVHSIQSFMNFCTQVGSLLGVLFLVRRQEHSLVVFALVVSFIPLIIQFLVTVYAFTTRFKEYTPKWKNFDRGSIESVFGLGLKFVIVQLMWMMITTTDSYLIAQWISPEDVVNYTVAWKYFGIINIGFVLLMTPYWSAYTHAFTKKDFNWIEQANRKIGRYVFIFTGIELVLFFLAPLVIEFWISGKVVISTQIHLSLAVFTWMYMYLGSKNYFLNGIGKLAVQMRVLAITAILHFPLSYLLCVEMNGGIAGIVWGTNLCIVINVVVSSVQVKRILNQTANGIWNK
jgi:O-antigen/teichoic acid export membrane protein